MIYDIPADDFGHDRLLNAVKRADPGDTVRVRTNSIRGLALKALERVGKTDIAVEVVEDKSEPPSTGGPMPEFLRNPNPPDVPVSEGCVVRPMFPPRKGKPLVAADFKEAPELKAPPACQSMEPDYKVAQNEAFAKQYGQPPAKAGDPEYLPLMFGAKPPEPGVPNANGDSFGPGVWDKAIGEYMEKVKSGEVPDHVLHIDSMAGEIKVPGPVKHTTVKPTEEQIAEHQRACKAAGTWSFTDPMYLSIYRRFFPWAASGRWLSHDYRANLPFFRMDVIAKAPSGQITVVREGTTEVVPFENIPKQALMLISAFAANPRRYLEEEAAERAKEATQKVDLDNPCRDVVTQEMISHRVRPPKPERSESSRAAHLTPPRWQAEKWGYAELNKAGCGETEKVCYAEARDLVASLNPPKPPEGVAATGPVGMLRRAYEKQSSITVPAKSGDGEAVLIPPDTYDDDQKFLCQFCGKEYVYGEAKKEFAKLTMSGPNDPLMYCSDAHKEAYWQKHHRQPAVAAEILLGREMCNLHEGLVSYHVDGKELSKIAESAKTVGLLVGIDDVARSVGMDPVGPDVTVVDEKKRETGEKSGQ